MRKEYKILLNIAGSAILSFGLFNVHSLSGVTEGGFLGLTLLLRYWFNISPAVSGFVLNACGYIIGIAVLGKRFVAYSIIAGLGFSAFYGIFEWIGPMFPQIAEYPLLAAIAGAVFVGIGTGLCVSADGAPCGDDALAMSLSKIFKMDIRWSYLIFDFIVLALSLTYLDFKRIIFSLLTVFLSGQIIGILQKKIKQ
ncbi:MAG: YitT family protein [Clostridia bacterium]|nr:YitT family protein [Clostridia bacterium]